MEVVGGTFRVWWEDYDMGLVRYVWVLKIGPGYTMQDKEAELIFDD